MLLPLWRDGYALEPSSIETLGWITNALQGPGNMIVYYEFQVGNDFYQGSQEISEIGGSFGHRDSGKRILGGAVMLTFTVLLIGSLYFRINNSRLLKKEMTASVRSSSAAVVSSPSCCTTPFPNASRRVEKC